MMLNTKTFSHCRVTIAYFAISGFDVLNHIDAVSKETKTKLINWIYSLQVVDEISKLD